jgi:hypothetical protein
MVYLSSGCRPFNQSHPLAGCRSVKEAENIRKTQSGTQLPPKELLRMHRLRPTERRSRLGWVLRIFSASLTDLQPASG